MPDPRGLGRALIAIGTALVAIGLLMSIAGRIPFVRSLGRLPGDILFRRGSTTAYVPIVTPMLLSLVLTIALNLIFRQ